MITQRLAQEITYQLDRADEHERLAAVLSQAPFVTAAFKGHLTQMMQLWAVLAKKGIAPKEQYAPLVEAIEDTNIQNTRRLKVYRDALSYVEILFTLRAEYDFAERIIRALNDEKHYSIDKTYRYDLLIKRSVILLERGNIDEAFEVNSEALEIARSLNDENLQARAIAGIGRAYFLQGKYEEALEHLHSALEIGQRTQNLQIILLAQSWIGIVHFNQSRLQEALTYFEQQSQLGKSIGDRHVVMMATGNMGNVYAMRSELDRASEYMRTCLAMAEELGDLGQIMSTTANLGQVSYVLHRYQDAFDYNQNAFEIAKRIGEKPRMAWTLTNTAMALNELGRHREAAERAKEARQIAESIGDPGHVADALIIQGMASRMLGHYESALEFLLKASSMAADLGERNRHSEAVGQLGITYAELQMESEAIAALEKALVIEQETDNLRGFHGWNIALNRIRLTNSSDLDGIAESLEQSLQYFKDNDDESTVRSIELLLCRLQAMRGDPVGAIQKFESLLSNASQMQDKAELSYWCWKIAPEAERNRSAIELYETLQRGSEKFEYVKILAELRGGPIPLSADDLMGS